MTQIEFREGVIILIPHGTTVLLKVYPWGVPPQRPVPGVELALDSEELRALVRALELIAYPPSGRAP